jgi:hypothetical protein
LLGKNPYWILSAGDGEDISGYEAAVSPVRVQDSDFLPDGEISSLLDSSGPASRHLTRARLPRFSDLQDGGSSDCLMVAEAVSGDVGFAIPSLPSASRGSARQISRPVAGHVFSGAEGGQPSSSLIASVCLRHKGRKPREEVADQVTRCLPSASPRGGETLQWCGGPDWPTLQLDGVSTPSERGRQSRKHSCASDVGTPGSDMMSPEIFEFVPTDGFPVHVLSEACETAALVLTGAASLSLPRSSPLRRLTVGDSLPREGVG